MDPVLAKLRERMTARATNRARLRALSQRSAPAGAPPARPDVGPTAGSSGQAWPEGFGPWPGYPDRCLVCGSPGGHVSYGRPYSPHEPERGDFVFLPLVAGYLVWPDVGTRVRWFEDRQHRRGGRRVTDRVHLEGRVTRVHVDPMAPKDIDVWARPDNVPEWAKPDDGDERRVAVASVRVPVEDVAQFVARAEHAAAERERALAAPPERSQRERALLADLERAGVASVAGGPSARIVGHPSVRGRTDTDQAHWTVEVTWQGRRSHPFADEPPMALAAAREAALRFLLEPERWPGSRLKKISRVKAAEAIESALRKAGYTEIRRAFDVHQPQFSDVTIHAKDPAYRSERVPERGHGTISIGAHDGRIELDKTFAMFTDSALRTHAIIDGALAGYEIDVLLDPAPTPKTELDPLDAYMEIYRAVDESTLDPADPARLYIGDLTEPRRAGAPRRLPLMRRDDDRSRIEGRTMLRRHPIGSVLVYDDGRIEVGVEDEKDRPLVQGYVDRAIQGRRVVAQAKQAT